MGRWDETTYYLKNKGFSEDAIDRILSKCQVCAGENMRVLRDSLNRYLAPQGLTVCQIFTDLDRLIDKLFAEAEIKFPKQAPVLGRAYQDYVEKQELAITKEYCKKHEINQKLFDYKIMLFATDCWNIGTHTAQGLKRRQKEIEKCEDAVCWKVGEVVKENMPNPATFEFVSCTRISLDYTYVKIRYTFRGTNELGTVVKNEVIATANHKNCWITDYKY